PTMTGAPTRLPLSEVALRNWLGRASPGDVAEYYRGFLAIDVDPSRGKIPVGDCMELNRVAWTARAAAEAGAVRLVQRRVGADDYSYLAVVRGGEATSSAETR